MLEEREGNHRNSWARGWGGGNNKMGGKKYREREKSPHKQKKQLRRIHNGYGC